MARNRNSAPAKEPPSTPISDEVLPRTFYLHRLYLWQLTEPCPNLWQLTEPRLNSEHERFVVTDGLSVVCFFAASLASVILVPYLISIIL